MLAPRKRIRVMIAYTPHTTRRTDARALGRVINEFKPHVIAPFAPGRSQEGREKDRKRLLGQLSRPEEPRLAGFRGGMIREARDYFRASGEKPRVWLIEETEKGSKDEPRMRFQWEKGTRVVPKSVFEDQFAQITSHREAEDLLKKALRELRRGNTQEARLQLYKSLMSQTDTMRLRYSQFIRGLSNVGDMLEQYPELNGKKEIRVLAFQGGIHTYPFILAKQMEHSLGGVLSRSLSREEARVLALRLGSEIVADKQEVRQLLEKLDNEGKTIPLKLRNFLERLSTTGTTNLTERVNTIQSIADQFPNLPPEVKSLLARIKPTGLAVPPQVSKLLIEQGFNVVPGYRLEVEREFPGRPAKAGGKRAPIIYLRRGEAVRRLLFERPPGWHSHGVVTRDRLVREYIQSPELLDKILIEETLERRLRSRINNSLRRFAICRSLADELYSQAPGLPTIALDKQRVEAALPVVISRLKARGMI